MPNRFTAKTNVRQNALRAASRIAIVTAGALILCAAGAPRASAWGVTWSDEFTGVNNQPWSGNWTYTTGGGGFGNNEIQTYVNSWANSHVVSDGTGTDSQALQIQAQQDGAGRWYSAKIDSYGKHTFGPGTYLEFRCKFPNSGKGYWPAGWTLGTQGGAWPACGEIDTVEEINGQWENHQSLHMPGWDPTVVRTVNSSTSTYHNYGMWWPADTNSITFSTDGQNTATFYRGQAGTWEFNSNQQEFVILNLAIGGNWPGNPDGSTRANGNFDIDYVRQYN
ncbi:MAG: glycoside hydrolase family 16 protein [Capsulimonas sp.]|uniref:glycoside hydrolase family 16 protein n=1 Tax=Capsulimonas sp. TaxID=2494211 RepID=UPI003266D329